MQFICDFNGNVFFIDLFVSNFMCIINFFCLNENMIKVIKCFMVVIEFIIDGIVLDVNENFCKIMGYLLDEVRGKYYCMFCICEEVESVQYVDFWK